MKNPIALDYLPEPSEGHGSYATEKIRQSSMYLVEDFNPRASTVYIASSPQSIPGVPPPWPQAPVSLHKPPSLSFFHFFTLSYLHM